MLFTLEAPFFGRQNNNKKKNYTIQYNGLNYLDLSSSIFTFFVRCFFFVSNVWKADDKLSMRWNAVAIVAVATSQSFICLSAISFLLTGLPVYQIEVDPFCCCCYCCVWWRLLKIRKFASTEIRLLMGVNWT